MKMAKKRIFIAAHYLEIGGAEISLIGLLQSIDYSLYAVDLFLYQHTGELMALIPKEVNLLPRNPAYSQFECPLKQTLFSRYWRTGLARLKAKSQYWWFRKRHACIQNNAYFQYLANNITPLLPSLEYLGEYDLAVNFIGVMNIIRDKVKAKRKVAWIHTDYSKISVNAKLELPVWSSFDRIVSISDASTESFLKVFPSLKNKVCVIENILSPAFVRQRADIENVDAELNRFGGGVKILSTGRFCEQKNFDNLPDICRRLIEEMARLLSIGRFTEAKNYDNVPDICRRMLNEGVDVKWFIIGFGGDEQLIRQKIDEAGMQEHVIILGKRSNPYPYIKACDLYVQPSRYEGKSVTVREAQMLCKPVVVTDYPTAKSQIRNGVDGVIVPMDNAACAKGIAEVILDKALQDRLAAYLKCHDYGNESEIEKFYKLLM